MLFAPAQVLQISVFVVSLEAGLIIVCTVLYRDRFGLLLWTRKGLVSATSLFMRATLGKASFIFMSLN